MNEKWQKKEENEYVLILMNEFYNLLSKVEERIATAEVLLDNLLHLEERENRKQKNLLRGIFLWLAFLMVIASLLYIFVRNELRYIDLKN